MKQITESTQAVAYTSPAVEVIEVAVEKGFATSNGILEQLGDEIDLG
ncbi:MAG: hypothetical protein IJ013_03420 [Bacteroidaceae bacterium]|nr:hypothetical protein [Bacteroidaceae bacterium]